jgi:MFS superfamily sulfate permease-like transporter
VVTIAAILLTNLLLGIFIGIAVGLVYVLKTNFHEAITFVENDKHYLVRLNKDISFLNKAVLRKKFEQIREGATVVIDGGNSQFIDADIAETIEDFVLNAPSRNIQVELRKSHDASNEFFRTKDQDMTRSA